MNQGGESLRRIPIVTITDRHSDRCIALVFRAPQTCFGHIRLPVFRQALVMVGTNEHLEICINIGRHARQDNRNRDGFLPRVDDQLKNAIVEPNQLERRGPIACGLPAKSPEYAALCVILEQAVDLVDGRESLF